MHQQWAVVLFALALAVFSVSLWPALMEMRRKRANVLAIDRQDDGTSGYTALQALKNDRKAVAAGNLHIGPGHGVMTAACTDGLHLGRGASINAALAPYISLYAQTTIHDVASATDTLWVQPDCQFRWLDAPTVKFTPVGGDVPCTANDSGARASVPLAGAAGARKKFTRVEGDWRPDPHSKIDGDYVVTADVNLAQGCVLFGNLKAYGNVKLEPNSFVHGSVFAEGSIELSPAAQVLGVVSAGRQVRLRGASVVGRIGQLSSVSAPSIVAHAGAQVHGSVRARKRGWSCT
jgi:hypothetical protein